MTTTAQLHERIETALYTRPRAVLKTALDSWFATKPSRDDWEVKWPRLIDSVYKLIAGEAEASFEAILKSGPDGHATLRCNLATGETALTRAPGQRESRIILDGSSGDQLAAYRGACRLFGDLQQKMLAMASEILIVAAPSVASWILRNAPHPVAPTHLRIIIILPQEDDDWDHFDDMHKAAHVAAALARISAGLATVMWFLSESYTRVSRPDAGRDGKVVANATGPGSIHFVVGRGVHPSSETVGMFLGSVSGRIEVTDYSKHFPVKIGRERGVTIVTTGGRFVAHWLGYLSGRGLRFRTSGFRCSMLPAAFTRRAVLVFADTGGGDA